MSQPYHNDSTSVTLQYHCKDTKPDVTKESIPELVYRLYGLQVEEIQELPSYDDVNFYVQAGKIYENKRIQSINADGYVLKILNSIDSARPDSIVAQHSMSRHLRERGIQTQVPVPNIEGNEWSLETFNDQENGKPETNEPYLVRLVTFVPGIIFSQTTYLPESFYNVGKFVCTLHRVLKGFQHTSLDTRTPLWSFSKLPVLRHFLHVITCKENALLVEEVISAYERSIIPKYDTFEQGMIHGDLNDQNLIMQEVPGQKTKPRDQRVYDVSAILDFSDISDSYLVFDVAICICYMALECPDEGQIDAGGHFLAGYYRFCSLNDAEFHSLRLLICARLCQSLVYGAYSYVQDPENTYVLLTAERGWKLLHKFWQITNEVLCFRWKEIMKIYK